MSNHKWFYCNICDRRFTSQHGLDIHMGQHKSGYIRKDGSVNKLYNRTVARSFGKLPEWRAKNGLTEIPEEKDLLGTFNKKRLMKLLVFIGMVGTVILISLALL